MASSYFYPRVCPILSLSEEDFIHAVEVYGREDCVKVLASLISENYDFPFARACNPRTPAPTILSEPRNSGRPKASSEGILLGGYRCTRLPKDIRIPGITLIMNDSVSTLDWVLDSFMESHRMKCWVTTQGRTRKWSEPRSPYSRLTNTESLTKLLDAELQAPRDLNHAVLREMAVSHGEAIPPTVELYLHTIDKLNPSSIYALNINYGVGLAAMSYSGIRSCYNRGDMTDSAMISLREFLCTVKSSATENLPPSDVDLVFIDGVPYGTHDLRAYLGEESTPNQTTYKTHLDKLLANIRSVTRGSSLTPVRIALVMSLRESSTVPTIEPLLLSLLFEDNLDLLGALVSQKKDYAVYLMLFRPGRDNSNQEQWKKLLEDKYPELHSDSSLRRLSSRPETSLRRSTPESWDVACLHALMSKPYLSPSADRIALQGPRKTRGKNVFPTRTRSCVLVSETSNTETGDSVYVFGESIDPPEVEVKPESPSRPVIADGLLSRMVAGIKQSMDSGLE